MKINKSIKFLTDKMVKINQMEIAKRLNAIIAQLLPFLSQEVRTRSDLRIVVKMIPPSHIRSLITPTMLLMLIKLLLMMLLSKVMLWSWINAMVLFFYPFLSPAQETLRHNRGWFRALKDEGSF